jgi:hypothetical protein
MTTVVKPMASILEFQHDSVLSIDLQQPQFCPNPAKKQRQGSAPRHLLIGELLTRNSVGEGKRKEKNDNPRIIKEAIGYVPICDPPVGHAGSC